MPPQEIAVCNIVISVVGLTAYAHASFGSWTEFWGVVLTGCLVMALVFNLVALSGFRCPSDPNQCR